MLTYNAFISFLLFWENDIHFPRIFIYGQFNATRRVPDQETCLEFSHCQIGLREGEKILRNGKVDKILVIRGNYH